MFHVKNKSVFRPVNLFSTARVYNVPPNREQELSEKMLQCFAYLKHFAHKVSCHDKP